jgi:hypothetical protein
LEECYQKYPDYFLIQLRWYLHLIDENENDLTIVNPVIEKFENLLSGVKQAITNYEYNQFLSVYITIRFMKNGSNKLVQLVAMEDFIKNPDIPFSENSVDEFLGKMDMLKLITLYQQLLSN